MNKSLKNLHNLFSEDDKVVIEAVKEKKDWILNTFYFVASLKDNTDIEDIMDYKLRFKKLYLNPELFVGFEKDYEAVSARFNDAFRVLYLDKVPKKEIDDDEFIVEVDFKRLTNLEYNSLCANFFPCFNIKDLEIDNFESNESLLKCAMDTNMGDDVIVLDKKNLIDQNTFASNVITGIIVKKNFNKGYLPSLKLMCESLKITLKED